MAGGIKEKGWQLLGVGMIGAGGFNSVTIHDASFDGAKQDPTVYEWGTSYLDKQDEGIGEIFVPWLTGRSEVSVDAGAAQTSTNNEKGEGGAAAIVANELLIAAGGLLFKYKK